MPNDFETNLLRVIAGEFYFSLVMQTSREMYGKSYFSLGVGEKAVIDQAVFANVGANCKDLTPEFLRGFLMGQTAKQPVGFQTPIPIPEPNPPNPQ